MRKEITKAKTTYCYSFADSSSPRKTGQGASSGAAGGLLKYYEREAA